MLSIRRCRDAARGDEQGFALVVVTGTMTVLMLFLLTTLAFVVNNSKPNRRGQDAKTALAAAQAGVDEYVSRLTATDDYWTRGNLDTSNNAFDAGGTPIPGGAAGGATFKYSVLTNAVDTATNGIIRLRSTGTSRGVSKTITAKLTPSSFLKYIYYSDIEVVDPALAKTTDARCSTYYYSGRSGAPSGTCSEIQWTGGDTVDGPLHSNDALQINGSVNFTRTETGTSWKTPTIPGHYWWGTGTPLSVQPRPEDVVPLPQTNQELQTVAASGSGCVYSGETRIKFTGATMQVLSPGTRGPGVPPRCYNTLSPNAEQSVAIPSVIYVTDTSGACGPVDAQGTAVGYPQANEDTTARSISPYNCAKGDAFVEGTLTGRTTLATSDNIIVTNDINYSTGVSGTDVLGLIADNYVWVYHPVKSDGTNLKPTGNPGVFHIDAAILSVKHSFVVQNWDAGEVLSPVGGAVSTKLTIRGSIAQKFRGPVGTTRSDGSRTGYLKNYVYDDRLQNLPPPFFLKPATSPWHVQSISSG